MQKSPFDDPQQSVLPLHSLFSPNGDHDWIEVAKVLREKGFQVLTPSLTPDLLSNYDNCVSFLAEEIKNNSSNKVHIVSLSSVRFLALKLTMAHPNLVSSVLISGFITYPLLVRLLAVIPIYITKRRVSRRIGGPKFTLRNCRSISKMLTPLRDLQSLEANTMMVVASIGDWLQPSLTLRKKRHGNADFSVKQAKKEKPLYHLWNRQRPILFADLVGAWANNTWSDELDAVFVNI